MAGQATAWHIFVGQHDRPDRRHFLHGIIRTLKTSACPAPINRIDADLPVCHSRDYFLLAVDGPVSCDRTRFHGAQKYSENTRATGTCYVDRCVYIDL